MLKEQVADAIDITHLNITAREQVTLLIASRDANSDVCFQARELVGLRGHDRDHVALLALDRELADGGGQVAFLVRCDGRTND